MTDLSRRSFVLGIALGSLALGATPSLAQFAEPVAPSRFSGVAVDVGPLLAKGLGRYAEFIRTALLSETRQAFSDLLGGPGPRLVVRITGVYLSGYVGGSDSSGRGSGGGGGGGSNNDYLEGEALIVGPRGEVLSRHPQLSAVPASSGGAWYTPGFEERRTAELARHYALWLRRDLGP